MQARAVDSSILPPTAPIGEKPKTTPPSFTGTLDKIQALFGVTDKYIEKNVKNDPKYADRYYYYWITDSELTETLKHSFSEWKTMAEKISRGKYTILRESTVSRDEDDYNSFVIAVRSKISI